MRELKFIALHCSASPVTLDIGAKEIRQWHKAKKWSDIGYHYVIRLNGKVELGRALWKPGAHISGWNESSIGVCYIGGVDSDKKPLDTMNERQQASFRAIVKTLRAQHGPLEVYGHNDFTNAKACPSFQVSEKFADLKLDPTNQLPKR